MAKYSFKVYLTDGSSVRIVPFSMKDTDLYDMDKFIEEKGSFIKFSDCLANELDINSNLIEKITILRNKKEVEFSLALSNPYLDPVLNDLEKKKIQGYGPYQVEVMVVSSDNPVYLEMRKYVFENLKNNYENFLKNIYTYSNEFSKLLYRYGVIYKQGVHQEEDLKCFKELEDRIGLELRIYKNYRGMCRRRYKYENTASLEPVRISKKKVSNLSVSSVSDANINLVEQVPYFYESACDYNSEHEEFLDDKEYTNMVGEGNSYKRYK